MISGAAMCRATFSYISWAIVLLLICIYIHTCVVSVCIYTAYDVQIGVCIGSSTVAHIYKYLHVYTSDRSVLRGQKL